MKTSSIVAVCLSVLVVGCKKPNPEVCCVTTEQCSEIGVSDFRLCSDGLVCQDNRCISPADGGVDGGFDAGIDAPGVHVFDIAYPNEWRFSVAGPISGYFLAINTNNVALDMTTLELKSIDDDHPSAIVRVTVTPSPTVIEPATVGGALTPLSRQVLLDSGLVTEPRSDTASDYLTLEIENAPNGTYDINVDLIIAIDSIRIPMPMTIHMVPLTTVFADPLIGKRKAIYR